MDVLDDDGNVSDSLPNDSCDSAREDNADRSSHTTLNYKEYGAVERDSRRTKRRFLSATRFSPQLGPPFAGGLGSNDGVQKSLL